MTATASLRRATTILAVMMAGIALTAAALMLAVPSAVATGPHNQFIAVNVGSDGRFNIGAYPGADGSPTTGSWDLSYKWDSSPWSSFTTLQVDGSNYKFGTDGTALTPPTDAGVANTSAWQTGDIRVTQQLSLVANSATGRQDVVRIAYTAKNTGTAAHAVGLRLMIDTEVNYNDNALFRVPGVGALTTERDFTGAAVPHGSYVFYDLADSTHVAFVASGFAGPAPDRMVFAHWRNLYYAPSLWDYAVDQAQTIGDSAYALYWNATSLAPGQSRTYVSSYGLGASDADLTPPLALGVYGPSQLDVVGGGYSPNPFDVTAWVSDVGSGAANNVTATIELSDGLQLANGDATQNLGTVDVNQEKQASWSVSALPQAGGGSATYSVTVACDGVAPKTVTRQLELPAIVPAPSITMLQPASGKRRALVTITGTSFGAAQGTSSVKFGSKTCTKYVSWSDTKIKCRVPANAKFGVVQVTVTTTVGTSNTKSFRVKR